MIDINVIRENPNKVKEALKKKLWDTDFTELLSWDQTRRELLQLVEGNKAEMNKLSASVPIAKKNGEDVSKIFAKVKEIAANNAENEKKVEELDKKIFDFLAVLPNIPDDDLLPGEKENNKPLRYFKDNYYLASSLSLKVKIHRGIEIDSKEIENLAFDIVDYIEKNHKLPKNISISNEKISISQYLSLISLDILNINGDDSPILLENISLATSSNENCKEGTLDKANYIKLVKSVYSACSWGSAPNYISSSLGNIGFNSLVYTLSNILKSYSVYGVLPESVHIYPWSVVSNSKTSFITCDSIMKQADYIKNYVESKHALPSSISINSTNSLVKINIAQFLKLELDLLVQLPSNSIQSFVLKTYKTAPKPQIFTTDCSDTLRCVFEFKLCLNTLNDTCICIFRRSSRSRNCQIYWKIYSH